MTPRITVRAVQPVIAALQALEYKTGTFLSEVGMNPKVLENPDGRVPRHPAEFLVTSWLRFGRLIIGNTCHHVWLLLHTIHLAIDRNTLESSKHL